MITLCFISGNIEIGNGYGVPGGGAYYGAPRPNISMLSMANQQNRELEQKPMANELPDYLKQKLRARSILKDETAKGANVNTESVSLYILSSLFSPFLPPIFWLGWYT